jgi:signal transduction histidine kinase
MNLPSDSVNTTPTPTSDLLINQQKRELVILKSIFQIISGGSSLSETLEKALEYVLAMIDSSVGWICLHDQEGGCSSFVGHQGLCFLDETGKPTPCLVHCVCDRVRKTRDVVVVNKLTRGCPLLLVEGEPERQIVGHISVPLTTQSRLVGQLNIAFNNPHQVSQNDIELLRTIGPQMAVAIENARLWEELQNKEQMLKKLLKNVVGAQEEERRRISRELHDEMGQNLSSLLIGLSILEKTDVDSSKENVIGGMSKTVSGMITSIHDLALELRPTSLDDLGLIPALTQYILECPARLGIQVDYEIVGGNGRHLTHEAEITAYRIVQESLTNVARHSNASKANVILNQSSKSLTIIIEDNGVGFDIKEFKDRNRKLKRLGLYGMEERAALVGGSLTVESAPGVGTSIYVDIPWEAETHE